jgi:hypothetical protein
VFQSTLVTSKDVLVKLVGMAKELGGKAFNDDASSTPTRWKLLEVCDWPQSVLQFQPSASLQSQCNDYYYQFLHSSTRLPSTLQLLFRGSPQVMMIPAQETMLWLA